MVWPEDDDGFELSEVVYICSGRLQLTVGLLDISQVEKEMTAVWFFW